MNRDDVLSRLRQRRTELQGRGVAALYLFGSTARQAARSGSDVDLFFDHEPGALSLFDVMDIGDMAAAILGQKVDLMIRSSIDSHIRARVEAGAVRVF